MINQLIINDLVLKPGWINSMKIFKKPATNEKEVQKLELELNIKFTEEYFQFLLRYNGGVTEKKVFKAGEFGRSIIHGFHGVLPSDPI